MFQSIPCRKLLAWDSNTEKKKGEKIKPAGLGVGDQERKEKEKKKKNHQTCLSIPPAFMSPFSLPPGTPPTHYGNNTEAHKHRTHTSNDRPLHQVF